ncbi:2',3'-cyclic-nucleotide 2'-phosphodiesterase (5'-nucleotidase family) [Salirhabdus euzebyi]|uniref:2',3'-cyclic-nucleotide 2'-phosphodiesterase (5'-nucleotidase family) n=1 Tax=Salirhabdus euzebyi TaxID=394506 RepID=A0A841PZD6_9BACI|nr:metallophosphoesterase [Salirhabdus euzebyi]MBB6452721.1 2',3'-cyclic-nucleotide 2'-phosphodiesterase (5'-nucleotidase family) [Salirhabdus euzebyi]
MKLKILHTNDVHSNFENFSKAASLIKELKDDHTILLDGGDFADFKSIELRGTKGIAAIELLQAVGYEAITIGNNETFNGVDVLEHMASTSSIPFISNNLLKKDLTKINGVVTSTIIEKNGVRILITGSSPDIGDFNDGLGVHINDYEEAVVRELEKNSDQYDISILLSHIGTDADQVLAEKINDINIILSAHDHQLYTEAKIINGTILNSAGNYAEHVGVLEVEVEKNRVTLLHSVTMPTKDAPIDETILSILRKNKEIAVENLSRPLYSLAKPLWHDVIEENPISNLIADGLKDMLQTDIGLINSGIVNSGIFHFMSNKKLIEICPSPLNPTYFEVQGKDLFEALVQSLDAQICLSDGRGPGFRGKFVGSLHISGAEIVHDGKNILEIKIGNEPLIEEKWYSVGSSDYLQRGSGYPSLANNRNVSYRPEEIRDVINLYANKTEYMDMTKHNRWKVAVHSR